MRTTKELAALVEAAPDWVGEMRGALIAAATTPSGPHAVWGLARRLAEESGRG